MSESIVQQVRSTAAARILFLPHAVRQMSRPGRMISTREIERVVAAGVLVEDYPEDLRGHSCLLLGFGAEGRPVHVVCAPKPDYLAIITAYRPDAAQWSNDYRRRIET